MRAVRPLLPLLAALLLAAPAAGVVGDWRTNPHSSVRLVTPWAVAPAEGVVTLGLEMRLAPGWHSYWRNPGDAGFPPRLEFRPGGGLEDAELLFPAPRRYALPGGLEAFGYEEEVVYPVRARLQASGRQSVALTASLDYLVCEVECVPYRYELELEQPVGPTPLADAAGEARLSPWLERLPVAAERSGLAVRQRLARSGDDYLLRVEIDGAGGEAPELDLFLEAHDLLEPGAARRTAVDGGVGFEVPLAPTRRDLDPPVGTTVAWTATGLRGAGVPSSLAGTAGLEPAVATPRLPAVLALVAGLLLALLAGWRLRRRAAADASANSTTTS